MRNINEREKTIISVAESKLGCPYVYGTWGQICTVALRKRYANYNPSQKEKTYARCPVLSGKQSTCTGCKYIGMLAFDCRGFTHWCLEQAGISISGGYVGRQWSDANWVKKGTIDQMPNLVCCVFIYRDGKWKHTGLHIGGGRIIHCSGEVKRDTVGGEYGWTHYGIPIGLYTDEEIEEAGVIRLLRKGSKGSAVKALQEMLLSLGYDCGTADGVYGAKTETAVRQFQARHGLTVDGIAGEDTQTAIAAAAAGVGTGEQDAIEAPSEAPEKAHTIVLTEDQYNTLFSAYCALKSILGV